MIPDVERYGYRGLASTLIKSVLLYSRIFQPEAQWCKQLAGLMLTQDLCGTAWSLRQPF